MHRWCIARSRSTPIWTRFSTLGRTCPTRSRPGSSPWSRGSSEAWETRVSRKGSARGNMVEPASKSVVRVSPPRILKLAQCTTAPSPRARLPRSRRLDPSQRDSRALTPARVSGAREHRPDPTFARSLRFVLRDPRRFQAHRGGVAIGYRSSRLKTENPQRNQFFQFSARCPRDRELKTRKEINLFNSRSAPRSIARPATMRIGVTPRNPSNFALRIQRRKSERGRQPERRDREQMDLKALGING